NSAGSGVQLLGRSQQKGLSPKPPTEELKSYVINFSPLVLETIMFQELAMKASNEGAKKWDDEWKTA
ncbi:unnamed protein product, partial [Sphenostylis stenocarpa]